MTVEADTSSAQYSTNGTTGPFAVPFYFLATSHLAVVYTTSAGVRTTLALTTDYSVSGAGDPTGGAITLVTAYAAGGTISIVRAVPLTQLTDYVAGDAFPADAHERALDKLTMIAQQFDEQVSRALRVPEVGTLPELPSAANRADKLAGFDSSGNPIAVAPVAGTATALSALLASSAGAAAVASPSGTVATRLDALDASRTTGAIRRRVPSLFARGDGYTRRDIFPIAVRAPGPGGVEVNKTPLELARTLGNVIARMNDADVWVSPNGLGTKAGTSRANAMDWPAAWRTATTGRKLLLIDTDGTYPPLSLLSGTHAGAAVPKWLQAIDGRVRMAAATSLGQPDTQTWTLHSGSVYKTVLTAATYDQPQAVLTTLVPNVRDGEPDSVLRYASIAALTSLGASGEGWFFDSATDTLYLTYYGNDLTVLGNRNFRLVYSSQTLDSTGAFSAEWLLGGCTVILEGQFELEGVWINSKEYNSTLPIFMAEGRLKQLCATSYGLRSEGLTYTSGRRCYRSRYDGLNGYKSSMSSSTGMTIEHDLVVMGAGDIGTNGMGGPHNNQGFSVHGKHNAMIFGALFEGNDGQGWADICDSTHSSASWGVGVITRDNYVDSGVSYGIYMDGSSGGGTGGRFAWLDTCVSEGNVRDLAAITSAVKVVNSQLTTQLAAAGGTITTYSTEAP